MHPIKIGWWDDRFGYYCVFICCSWNIYILWIMLVMMMKRLLSSQSLSLPLLMMMMMIEWIAMKLSRTLFFCLLLYFLLLFIFFEANGRDHWPMDLNLFAPLSNIHTRNCGQQIESTIKAKSITIVRLCQWHHDHVHSSLLLRSTFFYSYSVRKKK